MVPKELEFPQESHVLEKENPETRASKRRNLSSVNIVLCIFDMSGPGETGAGPFMSHDGQGHILIRAT